MGVEYITHVWKDPYHQDVKGSKLLVLLAIADYADEIGSCFASIGRLAEKTRLSDGQVRSNLRELEAAHKVAIAYGQGTETRFGMTNRYYVVAPKLNCEEYKDLCIKYKINPIVFKGLMHDKRGGNNPNGKNSHDEQPFLNSTGGMNSTGQGGMNSTGQGGDEFRGENPLGVEPSIQPSEPAPLGAALAGTKLTKELSNLRYDLATVYARWYYNREPSKNEIVAAIGMDAKGTIGTWFRRAYEDNPSAITIADFQDFLLQWQKHNPNMDKLSKPDTLTRRWASYISGGQTSKYKLTFLDYQESNAASYFIEYSQDEGLGMQLRGQAAITFLNDYIVGWEQLERGIQE